MFEGKDQNSIDHLLSKFNKLYEGNYIYFYKSLDNKNKVIFLNYLTNAISRFEYGQVSVIFGNFCEIQYRIEDILNEEEIINCNGNMVTHFINLKVNCQEDFFKRYLVPFKLILKLIDHDLIVSPCGKNTLCPRSVEDEPPLKRIRINNNNNNFVASFLDSDKS